VLVLDSGSTDHTLEIARSYGVEIRHRDFDGYASQRNAAINMADTEWILFLDADEYLTDPLVDEIRKVLSSPRPDIDGYRISRENRFGSRILRGGGWWPDTQLRLFRRDHGRYDASIQVHERLELSGNESNLESPMAHINFDSFTEFRAIQRRYASMQADQHLKNGETGRRRTIVGRPLREFWRRYYSLAGYRDGGLGLLLSLSMAWYEFQTWRSVRTRREPEEISSPPVVEPAALEKLDPSIDLSVVIVSYNTSDLLNICLSSIEAWLEASNRSVEIIVVDNAPAVSIERNPIIEASKRITKLIKVCIALCSRYIICVIESCSIIHDVK
jgi:glycosyltransferase involved in cell wall biosynthesis